MQVNIWNVIYLNCDDQWYLQIYSLIKNSVTWPKLQRPYCVCCCLYNTVAYADKPKILIARPLVRSAPRHFVWCSAEGYPPINISIFKNSTSLDKGTGLVIARLNETGNYSCVASNGAGTDTKYFLVTIVGKIYSSVGAATEILWFFESHHYYFRCVK